MRRLFTVRRLLAWGVLALIGAAFAVTVAQARAEAHFEAARAELLAGRADSALKAFRELSNSRFVGPRAVAGAALAKALQGQAADPEATAGDFGAFPTEALLELARRSPPDPL
ncbi:MAG TPA: hypothetical protein VI589_06290, partial [Vicinamibacteria bacterium]